VQTAEFVDEMKFAGGHVFTYSARPGTPAVRLKQPVPGPIARERSQRLRQILSDSAARFHAGHIGAEVEVLWEATDAAGPDGWRLQGLTDNYIKVEAISPARLWNQFSRVRLEKLTRQGLSGSLIS
jgi:threonylcarbamoyladenosine tRNA methylthiotransferase MtaB